MEATRLSGINTANVLTFCYTMSGIMAALGGIVSIGRSGICNGANANQPYDTDAIAALHHRRSLLHRRQGHHGGHHAGRPDHRGFAQRLYHAVY